MPAYSNGPVSDCCIFPLTELLIFCAFLDLKVTQSCGTKSFKHAHSNSTGAKAGGFAVPCLSDKAVADW